MRIRIVVLLATAVVLTLGASIASANSIATSTLSFGNGCCGPGPFGTMTIDLTSSTMATIMFTAAPGFLFLDNSIVGVNVNALSWTVSGLTGTPLLGFSGPDLSNAGAGTVDGFGNMNQTFNEFDGFTWALAVVTFTLTNNSGTWSSASNVLKLDSKGFIDAAHVGQCSTPDCSIDGSFTNTGFAGENTLSSGPPPVPEPASLLLFGTLLSAAALVGKRLLNA